MFNFVPVAAPIDHIFIPSQDTFIISIAGHTVFLLLIGGIVKCVMDYFTTSNKQQDAAELQNTITYDIKLLPEDLQMVVNA